MSTARLWVLAELAFLGLAVSVGLLVRYAVSGLVSYVPATIITCATMVLTYWVIERLLVQTGKPAPVLRPAEQREPWSRTLVLVLFHVLAATLGASLIETAQESMFGPATEPTILDRMDEVDRIAWIEMAIVVIVIAPLGEEALFRGFFLRRLMPLSPAAAWVLPAVLFAAQHFSIVYLPIYVWIGLVFAHAHVRTGRITAAILTHAGYNASCILLHLYA